MRLAVVEGDVWKCVLFIGFISDFELGPGGLIFCEMGIPHVIHRFARGSGEFVAGLWEAGFWKCCYFIRFIPCFETCCGFHG